MYVNSNAEWMCVGKNRFGNYLVETLHYEAVEYLNILNISLCISSIYSSNTEAFVSE